MGCCLLYCHYILYIGICQGVSAVFLYFFPNFFASLESTIDVRDFQRWVGLFSGFHSFTAEATFVVVFFSFFHIPIIHNIVHLSTPRASYFRILSKFFIIVVSRCCQRTYVARRRPARPKPLWAKDLWPPTKASLRDQPPLRGLPRRRPSPRGFHAPNNTSSIARPRRCKIPRSELLPENRSS